MTPDPRHLAALLSIADHGSFSRAAVARRISQPALSAQIALLEHQFGVRVLDRTPQGATLTAFGHILVRHARNIDSALARAAEELRLRKLGISGRVLIGATPIAQMNLLPLGLRHLLREMPDLQLEVIDTLEEDLTALLRSGKVDFGISTVGTTSQTADIQEESLLVDVLDLVVHPQATWATAPTICLEALAGAPWILPALGGAFRRQIDALFVSAGVQLPARSITVGSLGAVKAFVLHGAGVAVLPRQAVREECLAGRLRAVPLAHPGTRRTLGLRLFRDVPLSPLADRVVAAVRHAASECARTPPHD